MKKSQIRYSRGYLPERYSRRREFRKEKFWRKKMVFLWILFLILTLAYVIFFSPLFEIKEIKISGNRVIGSEEIQNSLDSFLFEKVLIFFNQNNVFLATRSRLAETLISDFPRIFSIEINKNVFKKTIDFKIIERKETGIFCKKDCYYIDKKGVIFEEAPQTSGTLILVIKDYSEGEVEIGKNVIEKEFMTELIDLRSYLLSQLGLKVLDFTIGPDPLKDLKIDTNEGWYILFDKSQDLKNQLEALELVLEKKIKEVRKDLEYIDLRIENRVYYK